MKASISGAINGRAQKRGAARTSCAQEAASGPRRRRARGTNASAFCRSDSTGGRSARLGRPRKVASGRAPVPSASDTLAQIDRRNRKAIARILSDRKSRDASDRRIPAASRRAATPTKTSSRCPGCWLCDGKRVRIPPHSCESPEDLRNRIANATLKDWMRIGRMYAVAEKYHPQVLRTLERRNRKMYRAAMRLRR